MTQRHCSDSLLTQEENELRQSFSLRYHSKVEQCGQRDDFIFSYVMQKGKFGNTVVAVHKQNRQEFVIKVMEKSSLVQSRKVDSAYKEKQVLGSLSHPFVIHLACFFMDKLHVYLATPYVGGGDLYSYIMWSGCLPNEETAKFFTAQVLLAIEYLHVINVIHRDIKPENVVITENGYVKLIDFEKCSIGKDINYTVCGTRQYMAPEVSTKKGYGKSVDIWSFGVLVYELSTFELPFNYRNDGVATCPLGQYKITGGIDFNVLMSNLLTVSPRQRMMYVKDTKYLKKSKWFENIDFGLLLDQKLAPPYLPPETKHPRTPFWNQTVDREPLVGKYDEVFKDF